MRTRLGRQFARAGVIGVAATVCALGLTGVSGAAPVIDGNCASTLKGEDGQPLTVDVSALANEPGAIDVGTGAEQQPGDSAESAESAVSQTTLALPVKEALGGLGLSEADVVVDPLGQVCDTAQTTVNTAAEPVQDVLPGGGSDEPGGPEEPGAPENPDDPGGSPEAPAPPPGPPEAPPADDSPEPGPGENAPGGAEPGDAPGTGPGDDAGAGPTDIAAPAPPDAAVSDPAAGEPLGSIDMPPTGDIEAPPAPSAPGLELPNGGDRPGDRNNPDEATKESGTAEALPAAQERERLPLALSVGLLVLVVAGLARAWLRRKSA